MTRTDAVLAAIDAALDDPTVGPDAMRSAPDGVSTGALGTPIPTWEVTVDITPDLSRFEAAVKRSLGHRAFTETIT